VGLYILAEAGFFYLFGFVFLVPSSNVSTLTVLIQPVVGTGKMEHSLVQVRQNFLIELCTYWAEKAERIT
jgi:hypothetical protein